MITKALLVGFVYWLCHLTGYHAPNMLLDRPLFLGPLIGFVLGDFETGCVIGAQLEMIFMGIVFVGSASAADPGASTAIAVAFAILNNLTVNEAVAIATPIGYLCALIISLEPILGELFTPIIDSFLKKDDYKGWTIVGHALSFVELAVGPLFVVLAICLGGPAVESIMGALPEFVMNGINAAASMLPAVGLAVLISQMWNKRTSIFFFFGFFLMKYMNLDIIFLSIIAIFIAVKDVFDYLDNRKTQTTVVVNDEEDFFNE